MDHERTYTSSTEVDVATPASAIDRLQNVTGDLGELISLSRSIRDRVRQPPPEVVKDALQGMGANAPMPSLNLHLILGTIDQQLAALRSLIETTSQGL